MNPGSRVRHTFLGEGTVVSVSLVGGRHVARVRFPFMEATVSTGELALISPGLSPKKPSRAPVKLPTDLTKEGQTQRADVELASPEVEARRGITALRLGQILESQVSDLSVGLEGVSSILEGALNTTLRDRRPTFILVEGAWGSGKTHALTYLRAKALEHRMLVASATMDGNKVSLSDPMQLLQELLANLCIPGESPNSGIGHALREAKVRGAASALKSLGAGDFARALEALPLEAFDEPEALQAIEDYFTLALSSTQLFNRLCNLGSHPRYVPILRARFVTDRPDAFCKLLFNWSQFSSTQGAKGLLVVIDELDVEYASTMFSDSSSLTRRGRRLHLFRSLKALADQRCPLTIAFAAASSGSSDYDHDAVTDIQHIMGNHLALVHAPVLSQEHLRDLLAKLAIHYAKAYPHNMKSLSSDQVALLFRHLNALYRRNVSHVPRRFIRTALEALDLLSTGLSPETVTQILKEAAS